MNFSLTLNFNSNMMTNNPTYFNNLFIKFLSLFLVFNFTFVSSLKAETVFSSSVSLSEDDYSVGLKFNTDGSKMFMLGGDSIKVYEYTLTTNFDVSTANLVDSFDVSNEDTYVEGFTFNTDGTKMYMVARDNTAAYEYTLSTGFDVSTASFVHSFNVSAQENSPTGIAFNTDGSKMFISGFLSDNVNEYTLSTRFDISTASFVDSFSLLGTGPRSSDIAVSNNGTQMFVVDHIQGRIGEYTLSTGFDISTASLVETFDVSGQDVEPQDVTFNTDGTQMFMIGYNGEVYVYNRSVRFNPILSDPTINKDVIGTIDAQVQGTKRLAEQTTNSILDRIKHIRSQDPRDQTSQQDINVSFTNPDLTLATSLVTMPKIPNLNPFQSLSKDEWSTWTKADITIGQIGDTSLSSVQDIVIQAVSVGADKKINDNKIYGLSMRFVNDDTDIGNTGTNISTWSVNLSGYGSLYLDNDTFVDGVIGVGYMQSDLTRKSGSDTLKGDREGNQVFGTLKFGKQIKQSQFNIAPYGKIHSSYTQLEGYSETGTDALKFDALEIGATSGSVGLEIDRSIQYQESSVRPRFIIEYGKEIGSDSTQDMSYVDDTSTKYSYTSDQKDRDVMTMGIGFDFIHDNDLTLSADYERKQNDDNDYFDSVFIAANFLSRKESQYSLSFQGSDGDLVSQLKASKKLGLFDIKAQLENNFNTSANYQLSLSASHNF